MRHDRQDGPPADVLDRALRALDATDQDVAWVRVGGGCIHPAVRLSVRGEPRGTAFLKWAPNPGGTGFGVEARGLEALAAAPGVATSLRIPGVLAFDPGDSRRRGWLLLEWLEPSEPAPDTGRRLGAGLAALHAGLRGTDAAARPGWEEDGWIGPLPQANDGAHASWPEFWWTRRILEPIEALPAGRLPGSLRRRIEALGDRVHDDLSGWKRDGLSLLHGDLWNGNVLVTAGGVPALVDPAVYRGHREVDLAMMRLFGGFEAEVFEGYEAAWPLGPGFRERREPWYRLYPLLVHLHLFGAGYLGGIESAVTLLERS